MSINWMTLLAQLANFLILVWLLKRFLYQPVRRMIAEREKTMTEHLRRGEVMQEEAREREKLYEGKIREFEARREQMLQEVREEAAKLRRELHDEAIQQANKERALLLDELQQEKQQFEQSLREQVLGQACELAGQVVRDLTHRRLESVLIDALAERLELADSLDTGSESNDAADLELAAHALVEQVLIDQASGGKAETAPDEAVTVRTSFEPADEEKVRLAKLAIRLAGRADIRVSFEVDPALVFGIELISTTEAVSWSARDYLNSLQEVALDRLIRGVPGGKTGAVAGD